MKNKDDQNLFLLVEKNSIELKNSELEAKLSKISTTIKKIYDEKETMKAHIKKAKASFRLSPKQISLSQ